MYRINPAIRTGCLQASKNRARAKDAPLRKQSKKSGALLVLPNLHSSAILSTARYRTFPWIIFW